MKIAKKILEMIESSARDLEGIADYLHNGLEHDSNNEAIKFLEKEFGLSKNQASSLLTAWDKLSVHTKMKMNTKEDIAWLDKFFDSVEESVSEDNNTPNAIVYALQSEKVSDKELQNLYLMAKGTGKADFKSAKKILDMLQKKLKYTVDAWGLSDVVKAIDQIKK